MVESKRKRKDKIITICKSLRVTPELNEKIHKAAHDMGLQDNAYLVMLLDKAHKDEKE